MTREVCDVHAVPFALLHSVYNRPNRSSPHASAKLFAVVLKCNGFAVLTYYSHVFISLREWFSIAITEIISERLTRNNDRFANLHSKTYKKHEI